MLTQAVARVKVNLLILREMKGFEVFLLASTVVFAVFSGRSAVVQTSPALPTDLTSAAAGPHERRWHWTSRDVDDAGRVVTNEHSVTELATGLHWWDASSGRWMDTVAEFVPVKGGFLAARSPHQVAVANDPSLPGAIEVVTPDGRTLRSSPAAILMSDRASGRTVTLGRIRPAEPLQVAANVLIFPDCFDNFTADLRVTMRRDGMSCDVVLRAQAPDPAVFGFAAETTEITAASEWFDTRPTAVLPHVSTTVTDGAPSDASLWFGDLLMEGGDCFLTDGRGGAVGAGTPVRREWRIGQDGRTILLEHTPYKAVAALFRGLPTGAAPTPSQRAQAERLRQTADIGIPRRDRAGAPTWPRTHDGKRLAAAPPSDSPTPIVALAGRPGVVIDYTYLNTVANYTFDPYVTTWVTGPVNLSGNVGFSPGAVVKFSAGAGAGINIVSGSTVNWSAAPFRPFVATAVDDNSLGEVLPGSTGVPSGTYAGTALSFSGVNFNNQLVVSNLVVRYADIGVAATGYGDGNTGSLVLRHAQVTHCKGAFKFQNANPPNAAAYLVQNALVYSTNGSGFVFTNLLNAQIFGEHLTIDGPPSLRSTQAGADGSSVVFVNSIIEYNASDINGVVLDHSFQHQIADGPLFVTAGGGMHYLSQDQTGVNWTHIYGGAKYVASPLETELHLRATTKAPTVLSGGLSSDLTVTGGQNGDSLWPNLCGYHYWLIDVLAANLAVGNATLTLKAGGDFPNLFQPAVTLATASPSGVVLNSGATVTSRGHPDALNRFCWYAAVQEQPLGAVDAGSMRKIFSLANSPAVPPTMTLQFVTYEPPADNINRRYLYYDAGWLYNSFSIRDAQFNGVQLYISPSAAAVSETALWFNNVFFNCSVAAYAYDNGLRNFSVRNNLVYGGSFYLYSPGTVNRYTFSWEVKDNLFANLNPGGSVVGNTGCNAYTAPNATYGGAGNFVNRTVNNFKNGPLGPWYYPPPTQVGADLGTLVDHGSRTAGSAALYHYTTQPSGIKEFNSTVDIGFHYSPCINGVPCDFDNDGIPDVIEDANGDGVAQANEFNWQAFDTDGDGLSDNLEFYGTGYGGYQGVVAGGFNPFSPPWVGQLQSWGLTTVEPDSAANLPTLTSYRAVSAGFQHNLGLYGNGNVFAWGTNNFGQTNVPMAAVNVVAVAAGGFHSLALTEAGSVVAWGDNASGQINVPAPYNNYVAIAAGYAHSLAITGGGTVVAWGDNTSGQTSVPPLLQNAVCVAAGQSNSLALDANGRVWAWGDNTYGQCNVPAGAQSGVVEIACGYTHCLALRMDGTVIAWGDATAGATAVPVNLQNGMHLAAGCHFSVVMRNDNTLTAFGDNTFGQCNVPLSLTNIQSMAAGYARVVAIPYTPTINYPVDFRRDFLIIYNTLLPDSVSMLNLYQQSRKGAALAPALGVPIENNLTYIMGNEYTTIFYPAVANWYQTHPALRPRFILLMYGIPGQLTYPYVLNLGGSMQNDLRIAIGQNFGRTPFISALNFNQTTDCAQYIAKLAAVGAANPLNSLVISGTEAGIGGVNCALDNHVDIKYTQYYGGVTDVSDANNVINKYTSAAGVLVYNNSALSALGVVNNVLAYCSWGGYGYGDVSGLAWAVNRGVVLTGNSSWFIAETFESDNGNWPGIAQSNQQSYVAWFSQNAFGGSNWDKTPVVAATTVAEPSGEYAKPAIWMPLWGLGTPAAQAIWLSQGNLNNFGNYYWTRVQVTGDPLVKR
jgi:Regulator of chromosome condensation (RCC1) repeat